MSEANPPLRCYKIGESSPTAQECLNCNINKENCIIKELLERIRELEYHTKLHQNKLKGEK